MKLTLEQLRTVALGAVSVREQGGGIVLNRFTDDQLALYDNTTVAYQLKFKDKARYTAGIKLCFRTDSTTLRLQAEFHKQVLKRRFFSVDVVVDGRYLDSLDNFSHRPLPPDYINEPYLLGSYEKTFRLGSGEKTVCVHLPWSAQTVLKSVELEDGASLEPVIPQKKLLVFGDSITQGYDILRPYNRPLSRLAELLDAQEVCKAIGGERFFPSLARQPDTFTPDYIYVAYGTNDWGVGSRDVFTADSKAFFAALRENYPDTPIFAITPIWRGNYLDKKAFGPFEAVEQGIRDAVAPLSGVTVIRGFDFVTKDPSYFSDRYLHPNDQGFADYAESLCEAFRKELGL